MEMHVLPTINVTQTQRLHCGTTKTTNKQPHYEQCKKKLKYKKFQFPREVIYLV